MAASLDDIDWSEETTSLQEVADKVSLPCVVRVCEGFDSGDDISSFSLGDLMKIDSCEHIGKVACQFVKWTGWDKPGSGLMGRYTLANCYDSLSIPVTYKGLVRVMPKHGTYYTYKSIADALTDFPRYLEVLETVKYRDEESSKMVILAKGDVLETIGWRKPKKQKRDSSLMEYLKCLHHGKDIIYIPSTVSGSFQVLRDDEEYTLQEVFKRFPLPQIVQFTETLSKEVVSHDIVEAFGNLDSYEGKMMLKSIHTERILVGHYKRLDTNMNEGKFVKRTVFVLPLSNPDLSEISVQYPMYLDSSDYEFFVAKNFTQTPTGPKVMDRALYVEFTKKAQLRFAEVHDDSDNCEETPRAPLLPPRGHSKPVAAVAAMTRSSPGEGNIWTSRAPALVPRKSPNTVQSTKPKSGVSKASTLPSSLTKIPQSEPVISNPSLSDIDWSTPCSEGYFKMEEEKDKGALKILKKGLKKIKSRLHSDKQAVTIDNPENFYEVSDGDDDYANDDGFDLGRVENESFYDYPDLSKMDLTNKKGISKPIMDTTTKKQFSEYTVEELSDVFRTCGMTNLSKICQRELFDGKLFSMLSKQELQSDPLNLKSKDLFKLEQIKKGWRPSHS
ncbi:uncharacterized protein LOC126817370 [Patella vulgata]|uniref:uncharacterized protein LOC126817370 n=1 Tax=Patella vulgata TaxID=6465 RepID=UPI00217FA080|nr:uncharacterized protein LOC126817370 [Patella vulgata]